MISGHSGTNHYRKQLALEFERRKAVNPRYSLRSFARFLAVSPSFLSSTKELSETKAAEIGKRLGYSNDQIHELVRLVRLSRYHNEGDVRRGDARDNDPSDPFTLNLDAFQAISDWYHYALRELVRTSDFKASPAWIARRLGLSEDEALAAFKRLERLGLIKKSGRSYVKTEAYITTPTDAPNQALKHYHSQVIEKAKRALYEQSVQAFTLAANTAVTFYDDGTISAGRIGATANFIYPYYSISSTPTKETGSAAVSFQSNGHLEKIGNSTPEGMDGVRVIVTVNGRSFLASDEIIIDDRDSLKSAGLDEEVMLLGDDGRDHLFEPWHVVRSSLHTILRFNEKGQVIVGNCKTLFCPS